MYGHSNHKRPDTSVALDELALLEIEDTVYVRQVSTPAGPAFAVFAADGTFLDTAETLREIELSVERNDMGLATLH